MTTRLIPFNLLLLGTVLILQPVWAQDCSVSIDSNDAMQFSTDEIVVDGSCSEIELTHNHIGTMPAQAMGHNWVLTRSEDAPAVNNDGMNAGLDNDYIRPDDERVIAHTQVIGGGESTTITFSIEDLDPEAEYTFFCSFPGHYFVMQGTFKID
jgi:azurin